jgi:microcystin degradation protein MlrC
VPELLRAPLQANGLASQALLVFVPEQGQQAAPTGFSQRTFRHWGPNDSRRVARRRSVFGRWELCKPMRIAVGGMMHESNTFCAERTDRARFVEGSLAFGADLTGIWRHAHHEMGGFLEGAERFGYEPLPTVMAWATPGGPVADEVLDEVTAAILAGCRKAPIDGLLLALHGAMVTPRFPSADAELLGRLRRSLGPKLPIVVSLDFHGNVSGAMAGFADGLVAYQTYPHVDQRERGLAAAELLVRTVRGAIGPVMATAKPLLIVNLLGQETDRGPMRMLLESARDLERRPPLLSISVMAGFPYADVPDMGPTVIAIADGDRGAARRAADELAQRMFAARRDFDVECPAVDAAVRQATSEPAGPVVLVDLGDNIGGGSAGDGTVILAELFKQNAAGFVVVLFAPHAARRAAEIGIGGIFDGDVGGATDRLHGEPVRIRGAVQSIHDGKWVEDQPRHGGRRLNDQGLTAVIDLGNANRVVLNSLRTPPFSLGQLTSLGIKPDRARILVVKAAVAYKAAYGPLARKLIAVDTPGLTAINVRRFTYQRIRRPIFPLDDI